MNMRSEALEKKKLFYHEFRQTNASLVLGLIIISFGIFLIPWFYKKCKELSYLDNNTPEPQRAAAILFLIPIGWFIITKILTKLIITGSPGKVITMIGWSLILFLIIKFLHDFSLVFGNITGTTGTYWFLILLIGVVGVVGTILQYYYMSILILFLIFVIPAMQLELNSHFSRITMKKDSNVFYN